MKLLRSSQASTAWIQQDGNWLRAAGALDAESGRDSRGNLIHYPDTRSAGLIRDRFNHEDVRILLRGGIFENQAAGGAAASQVVNDGVTVENGDFILNGNSSLLVNDHGFALGSRSFTLEFCAWSTSTSLQFLTGGQENNAPQLLLTSVGWHTYNLDLPTPQTFPMSGYALYTVQLDRQAGTTTTWLNGTLRQSVNTANWGIAWSSGAPALRFGRNNSDGGLIGKLHYVRVVEGLEYDPNADFTPLV